MSGSAGIESRSAIPADLGGAPVWRGVLLLFRQAVLAVLPRAAVSSALGKVGDPSGHRGEDEQMERFERRPVQPSTNTVR